MVQVAEQERAASLTEGAPGSEFGRGRGTSARRPRRERRTAKKLVGYTPEEFAEVCAQARRCGLPPARFIREVSLGAVVRPRRTDGADALVRELGRIGNTLKDLHHQLACEARAGSHGARELAAEARIEAALGALNAALDRVG